MTRLNAFVLYFPHRIPLILFFQSPFLQIYLISIQPFSRKFGYNLIFSTKYTNTSKFEHITPILKKLHCLPIKQRIDYKLCLLTYKTLKFSNLTIFTIIFLFFFTVCLQDHLIHRFCPSHKSEHLWVKGPFLSLLQDSGTPFHHADTRNSLSLSTSRSKLKTHLFKLASSLNSLPSYPSDCLTRIWFLFSITFRL